MKKKRLLKGFTLVELIIVMALFSLVMFSVAQLLSPVTKFYVRTSNFESSTACIDNMKRAIEGNLKYADRVRVYQGYNPAADRDNQVTEFWEEFFKDRQLIDCKGTIYVMEFSNNVPNLTVDAANNWVISGYSNLEDFARAEINSGKITLRQYSFDNTSVNLTSGATGGLAGVKVDDWYVNQRMYGNYNYQFQLGALSGVTPLGGFNPADCTIRISAYEVKRDHTGNSNRLIVDHFRQQSDASFSMKNVLDPASNYISPLADHKVILSPAGMSATYSVTGDKRYIMEPSTLNPNVPMNHPRYAEVAAGSVTAYDAGLNGADLSVAPPAARASASGFYFIFTTPDSVQDERDDAYLNAVEAVFTTTI